MQPKLSQKTYGPIHEVPLVYIAQTICSAWFRATDICGLP